MAMNVKFLKGLSTNFESLTKDANTFYYLTDTSQLYLGQVEITNKTASGGATAEDVKNYVGTIPTDANASTVVDYILEAIDDKTGELVIGEQEYDTIVNYITAFIQDYDTFETDILTVNALGGIAANTNLNGMTTHEILRKLLYPYVAPTVGNATASPNGGTYEKGTIQTITSVSISVTKKSEPITSVALYNGSNEIETKTNVAGGGTITFSGLNIKVPTDGNQLTVKVNYPDANGNNATITKSTTALTFVYPYYYGVCGNGISLTEELVKGMTKVVQTKGQKTYDFNCSQQHMVFAYPKSYGLLSGIFNSNPSDITSSFSYEIMSITGLDGTAQDYYVYKSNLASTGSYKVTFKH